MREINIGLYRPSDSSNMYPDFIIKYIFDSPEFYMTQIKSFEEYDDLIGLHANEFKTTVKMGIGAARLNIYIPADDSINTIIMLVRLLSTLYCTAFLEINIYHYDKDNDKWISQNFQFVPEMNWEIMTPRPHTINDAYY